MLLEVAKINHKMIVQWKSVDAPARWTNRTSESTMRKDKMIDNTTKVALNITGRKKNDHVISLEDFG